MCVTYTMCILSSPHIDFPSIGAMVPLANQGEGGQTICHTLHTGEGILTQSLDGAKCVCWGPALRHY